MDINYYHLLSTIKPLPNEEWLKQEYINADEEINQLQEEINSIAIDIIPFDKFDAILVFGAAMAEIIMDFFLSDPANPNSFASKCNHGENPIGKWMNSIHKKIDHSGNPLDFQGNFESNGTSVPFGERHSGNVVSFSGGDHRGRTYGHDLFRFLHAIQQYHDGKFSDGGFVNGQFLKVLTTANQYGKSYDQLSWSQSIWEYICHMFADFFSSKSLPAPGWSFLTHADNRELRKLADDMYKNGFNLRTELLKGVTVAVPEISIRIIMYLRYRNSEYSQEARDKKLHLLLLMTHGIATAVNIGKVIITENPVSINTPMILRTLTLVWACIKDQVEFNQRATAKTLFSQYKSKLELKKTMIVVMEGIYYTTQYQSLTDRLKKEYDYKVKIRYEKALELSNLHLEYSYWKTKQKKLLTDSSEEITELINTIGTEVSPEDKLQSLITRSCISNNEVDKDTLKDILLTFELPKNGN